MVLTGNVKRAQGLVKGYIDQGRKQLLKLAQSEVLGLDIGSSAVKLIQLSKDNSGYIVRAAGIADIVNVTEGESNDREINIGNAIHECLKSSGVQTRMAVCGVCGPEVAVRYFKFPLLSHEEIEGAVLLEAEQVCPFNVDDGAVDYQLIPDGDENVRGVMVAATNKVINTKSQLAESASLKMVLMDVDGLALLNCFNECENPKAGQTTAILNVGSYFTSVIIMGENALPFIRDMAYAGNDIVNKIAAEKNLNSRSVREILCSGEDSGKPRLEIGESLKKVCQKLITDVSETLRYYMAQEKSTVIEKIYVCGGFALAKEFVELLNKQLPAKPVLWNPFEKMRCSGGSQCEDILAKKGPAMAVAAGLAMRLP